MRYKWDHEAKPYSWFCKFSGSPYFCCIVVLIKLGHLVLCTSKQQSKNVLKDLEQRWKLVGIGVNLYLFWEQTAKMLRLSRTTAWLHATALHHIFWGPWSLADRGLNVYPSLCPSLPTLLQYSCQVDLQMSFVVVCLFLFSIISFTFEISPFPFP